jgi:hypothetical protein
MRYSFAVYSQTGMHANVFEMLSLALFFLQGSLKPPNIIPLIPQIHYKAHIADILFNFKSRKGRCERSESFLNAMKSFIDYNR